MPGPLSLSSPTSVAFLDVFRPLPSSGSLQFPLLGDEFPPHARELGASSLTDYLETSLSLLTGVREQVVERGFGPVGCGESGQSPWSVDEFGEMGFMSFTNLVRSSGEFIFIGNTEAGIESFVGRKASGILLGLAHTVNPEEMTVTNSYHAAFFGPGPERLRKAMGMTGRPLLDVALAMADFLTADTGEMPAKFRESSTIQDLERRKLYPLDRGAAAIAGALRMIDLTLGGPYDQGGGFLVRESLDGEYFSLCVQDEDRKTAGMPMPLSDFLKDRFWNFIQGLMVPNVPAPS